PSLLYGIYEQDAPDTLLLDVPRLYSLGRLGRLYRWYSFWINIVDALWQSVAIYFVTHMTYIDTDTDMWTFGFLLCAELLMVNSFHLAIEVKQWTIPFFLSLTLSFLAYFVFALTYNLFVGP
uniref:P-type ATPase C-terminal domain-containing protein n=1 Tax=Plectus sambesii TaxID=2011161 RepID=A0A914VLW1_9BILA